MATIFGLSMQLSTDAQPTVMTPIPISDAGLSTLMAWSATAYFPGQTPTHQQLIDVIAQSILATMKNNALEWEKAQAAAGVPPIV